MKVAAAVVSAAALPALSNALNAEVIPSSEPADSMAGSDAIFKELEGLNLGNMDGIKSFDGFKNFDEYVAKSIAEKADRTYCPIGMKATVGGNMGSLLDSWDVDGKTESFSAGVKIETKMVPCGSMLDPSDALIAAAGALGFKEAKSCEKEEACKCGALQVTTGVTMDFNYDEFLVGIGDTMPEIKPMLENFNSFEQLMPFLENLPDIPTETKEIFDKLMVMLDGEGVAVSTTVDMFACVSDSTVDASTDDTAPELGLDALAGDDALAGMAVQMETTAALDVTDPVDMPDFKAGAEAWFTTDEGLSAKVTIIQVWDVAKVIHGIEMPPGSTCTIQFTKSGNGRRLGDEEVEKDVAVASLTSPEQHAAMTALQAPTAPANTIAETANSMSPETPTPGTNAAATASTGLFASAAAALFGAALTRY